MLNEVRRQERENSDRISDTNLQETANVDFVVRVHEDNVLEEPEERPMVVLFGLQQLQDAIVLKEESAGAFCPRERQTTHGISADR